MNGENPLPLWLRHFLIGAGLFLSGAILAFGYSYRPLHGALSWQVEQLESRLDERNRENLKLADSLAKEHSVEANRIDPETLAQVKKELDQTKRVLGQAEKDLRRAEGKRKDANASAAKWRRRFKELEGRPTPVAAASPPNPPTASETKGATAKPVSDSAHGNSQASTASHPPTPLVPGSASASASASASDSEVSQATAERGIIPAEVATPSEAR